MTRLVELDHPATIERAVQEVVPADSPDATRPIEPVVISPGIAKPPQITGSRFFNPEDPANPPRIRLERIFKDGREKFTLELPIGY